MKKILVITTPDYDFLKKGDIFIDTTHVWIVVSLPKTSWWRKTLYKWGIKRFYQRGYTLKTIN